MEIFTNEFKELLTNQLVELADVVKTKRSNEMSDYEIAKAMENCMDCYEEENKSKKDKNKKNKKFKVGDVVYYGERKGHVLEQNNDNSEISMYVCFEENKRFQEKNNCFTKDGRFHFGLPVVLSHFPYELKMKKIKK
jgi:uncharacterized protein YlaI